MGCRGLMRHVNTFNEGNRLGAIYYSFYIFPLSNFAFVIYCAFHGRGKHIKKSYSYLQFTNFGGAIVALERTTYHTSDIGIPISAIQASLEAFSMLRVYRWCWLTEAMVRDNLP